MKMNYAIVTGASRGLGESIGKLFLESNTALITISRSKNEQLEKLAEEKGLPFQHFFCDLSVGLETEKVLKEVASVVFNEDVNKVYFVQNAGLVTPIGQVGQLDTKEMEDSLHVNLLSPMIATNEMLHAAKESKAELIVVNISSGAGSRPVHGWSTYCTTKAGLNMFTETVALELSKNHSRHKAIAFSPGIMDTDMQGTIRSSTKESFDDIEKFQRYKEEGMLRDTDTVAKALMGVLLGDKIESGKLYHVNNLL
jgi:benzil reductase ((S)-benzoin forming)